MRPPVSLVIILLCALCCPLRATAPTWTTANEFAVEYQRWAELRNVRVQSPGTISAPEMHQWLEVKAAWRRLEKQVEAEYRGEH